MAGHQGKVAFVTGASSGIGRAAAEAFVRRGYATLLADVDRDGLSNLAAELGKLGECLPYRCDVTDDENVRDAVQKAVTAYGRLDAAFNAAGIVSVDGSHDELTPEFKIENWNRVIAVDLTGVWSCMRHQIPEMVKAGGGSIVNCSSTAGLRASATFPAYTAAKHGVVGLTKAAALKYGRQGLRVNAVCPATVDTPQFRRELTPETRDQLISASPVGRVAEASEIADVVLWLCDDAPGFLTGQAIAIDGGVTAR